MRAQQHTLFARRCTLLNNSGTSIFPGDMLEWCFYNEGNGKQGTFAMKNPSRGTGKPRRITVKIATAASERVIGRALSFSKPGYALQDSNPYPFPALLNLRTLTSTHNPQQRDI